MTLKERWVNEAWSLASGRADFFSGARKIHRARSICFGELDDSLQLADAGYTKSKMTMLTKNYLHEESRRMAVDLWKLRREKKKYGSVSFTTFNHFVKGKGTLSEILEKKSKRASVFGPCIQSVCITWVSKYKVAVDVFYRTTEICKKFPADLVFIRDVLLKPFDFSGMKTVLTCHFANITTHSMYLVTLLPDTPDPLEMLREVKKHDKFFHSWLVRWTSRYLCKEHRRGIEKFSQAMRVCKDANERIDKRTREKLIVYLRKEHPGHKKPYTSPEEDEE